MLRDAITRMRFGLFIFYGLVRSRTVQFWSFCTYYHVFNDISILIRFGHIYRRSFGGDEKAINNLPESHLDYLNLSFTITILNLLLLSIYLVVISCSYNTRRSSTPSVTANDRSSTRKICYKKSVNHQLNKNHLGKLFKFYSFVFLSKETSLIIIKIM